MSVPKNMFEFVTGVAVGAAGVFTWQFLNTRAGKELTTRLSEFIKTKLDAAETASVGNASTGAVAASKDISPETPEEGVTDGTTLPV